MKPIKVVHSADIHFRPDRIVECDQVFEKLLAVEDPDLYVIAGDLFDRSVPADDKGGYPWLIERIAALLEKAPIVVVYGTPTHDRAGCYEPFATITATSLHDFTVLSPWKSYFLTDLGVVNVRPGHTLYYDDEHPRLLISGCSEPSPGQLEGDTGDGISAMMALIEWRRYQFPNLPALMVYHGPIAGATMANGQAVRDGRITIPWSTLPGTYDYIALGDIHESQSFADQGCPAYYPGSAYPVNWGEIGEKSFNVVTFAGPDLVASVDRVSYGFPPRKKLVIDFTEEGPVSDPSDYIGYQSWVVVRGTKSALAGFYPEVQLEIMLNDGALEGSRVTIEILPTETIRAAEITTKKSVWDKLEIYAEASSRTEMLTDDALIKLIDIEARGLNTGNAPAVVHKWRLDSIKLVGAVGVWKGLHRTELEIDFSEIPPGLVALTGPNGIGKTTLLENMTPFPAMLTRGGKLQDHFRLKESLREICFTDEQSGDVYLIRIEIDGKNKSGSCQYYIFKNSGQQSITDGRAADYEAKVAELFGSQELYLRSAFVTQKATKKNPDLSDATTGEKKAIFRELAGLDYLQAYSELARGSATDIDHTIDQDMTRIETIEADLVALPVKTSDCLQRKADYTVLLDGTAHMSAIVLEAKTNYDDAADVAREQSRISESILKAEDRTAKIVENRTELQKDAESYRAAIEHKDAADQQIREYDMKTARREELRVEQADTNAVATKVRETNAVAVREYQDELTALNTSFSGKEIEILSLETKAEGARKDIAHLEEKLNESIECPNCHEMVPLAGDDVGALKASLAVMRKKLSRVLMKFMDEGLMSNDITKQIEDLRAAPPEEIPFPVFDDTELEGLSIDLAAIDIATARATLSKAEQAGVSLAHVAETLSTLGAEGSELFDKIASLRETLDPEAATTLEDTRKRLSIVQYELEVNQQEAVRCQTEIEGLTREIEELLEKETRVKELKSEVESHVSDSATYRWLEIALGRDGIQALELDALSPSIAHEGNELLSSAYGPRFSVEIRTTRIAGKGSKAKQVEDFEIVVHDSVDGSEQPFDTLSGGEAVWIRKAIYDAFAITRDRNTGLSFLTACLDEADGALDEQSREAYFALLEAAHMRGGRSHTIVITHSPEAQARIPEQIDLTKYVIE